MFLDEFQILTRVVSNVCCAADALDGEDINKYIIIFPILTIPDFDSVSQGEYVYLVPEYTERSGFSFHMSYCK